MWICAMSQIQNQNFNITAMLRYEKQNSRSESVPNTSLAIWKEKIKKYIPREKYWL